MPDYAAPPNGEVSLTARLRIDETDPDHRQAFTADGHRQLYVTDARTLATTTGLLPNTSYTVAGLGIPANATFTTGASVTAPLSITILVNGVSTNATLTGSNVPLAINPSTTALITQSTTSTGVINAGSNIVMSSVAGLAVGMSVTGPGIPSGTSIATVSSPNITLNQATSASSTERT